MELWTEYEGRTIDGTYPLTKLLQPEGRSAFFSTSNGTGVPTVIRLIESHYDEAEILARWQEVTELDHPQLVRLKGFGQAELDGTALVYAVMEPVEANLGEILAERRLTVGETREVAASLVDALLALHWHGFVHEHVEPGNVAAVGEKIKLRSDCIREAPVGERGEGLRRRDVQDLAVVLLRALTQKGTLEAAVRDLPLPEPFDQIVRKGMSGEWGLEEIGMALEAESAGAAETTADASAVAAAPVAASGEMRSEEMRSKVRSVEPVSSMRRAVEAARGIPPPPVAPLSTAASLSTAAGLAPVAVERGSRRLGPGKILLGVGAVLVLLVFWYFMRERDANEGSQQAAGASATAALAPTAGVAAGGATGARAGGGSSATVVTPHVVASHGTTPHGPAAPGGRTLPEVGAAQAAWRVIAFTYNYEGPAQAKAESLSREHPELRAEVFTPNGHAPFLVAIGGVMSRDGAFALAAKARSEGLPRDIYPQNYKGAQR
jgi:hypothetical protein